ncbi:hypothetical protein FBUS_09376 [Fasciolopsis buskii]|uniref:HSA domain-containing protein n=1 Tax=Fasciolopsis buskii TaxID=27845 RepID=A0A8E0S4E6_9TREM|nr:hypothetical protein FBUS_09376 [Fasciolopsis buski]
MPCNPEDEYPPPTKKLRHVSPNPQCVFSVDEVDRICSSSKEKCELEVLTRELDSLDEDSVFVRMRHCLATGVSQPLGSSFTPLPFCPFAKRNAIDNFIYLPPKKVMLDCNPEPPEVVTTVSHSTVDVTHPEIALGARLEASVLQKIAHQKHQGLWSASRLPKVMEPKQDNCQHEYLMGDILWLSTDFAEERKWKKEVAFRVSASNFLSISSLIPEPSGRGSYSR